MEISALDKSLHKGIIMSKYLITKNSYGVKFAIAKQKIDLVVENDDEDYDELTTIWVGEDRYESMEAIDAIMARLEE